MSIILNNNFVESDSLVNKFQTQSTIHIAYALDDNFAETTAVSIASILCNTTSAVHFYLIENGLSEQNKSKLLSLMEKSDKATLTFHKLDLGNAQIKIPSMWPVEVYFRLFLPELFPELDRIIYLDGDTIAEGDISELWYFDMGDKYAAATPKMFAIATQLAKRFGIDWYFNSGVLLLDLRALRAFGLPSKACAIATELYDKCIKSNLPWFPDQNLLNYLLNGHVAILPQRMNANWRNSNLIIESDFTGLEDLCDAFTSPLIFHFAGDKPFPLTRRRLDIKLLEIKRYYFYKTMTPFSNETKDNAALLEYERLEIMSDNGLVDNDYMRRNMRNTFIQFAKKIPDVLNGRKLALWGAGDAIRAMMVCFASKGIYADAIVDGVSEKQGLEIFQNTIQNPDILRGKSNEYFVVLSMMNQQPAAAAAKILEKYGFKDNGYCHIFSSMWEFINNI